MTTRTYIGGPTLLVAADAITGVEFYNEEGDDPTGVYIATEEGFLTSENPADLEGFRTELRRLQEDESAPTPPIEHLVHCGRALEGSTLQERYRRQEDAPPFLGGEEIFVRPSEITAVHFDTDAAPNTSVSVYLADGRSFISHNSADVAAFSRVTGRMHAADARGQKEECE